MRSHFFQFNTLKQDKKYEDYLNSCREDLGKWFQTSVLMPHVFFVQSRKEYDKLMGRKTSDWVTGIMMNNSIFILDPKIYIKESSHDNIKKFWKVLKHEYSHIYYNSLTNGYKNPRWLNEGLACYLAEQNKKEPLREALLNPNKYFDKGGQDIYGVGFFWVKFLIEKYGKAKLLKLIKTIDPKTTKVKFNVNFKKVYGFGLTKQELSKEYKKTR